MSQEQHVARLKKGGKTFEILIKPKEAFAFVQGENIPLREILLSPDIYSDASKALKATDADMQSVFSTTQSDTIAKLILVEGEVQLSAEQRQKVRDDLYNKVITKIVQNAIDPQTGMPHPRTRIENALTQARFHVRESDSVDKNVDAAVKLIRAQIPLKFETVSYRISAQARYNSAIMRIVSTIGTVRDTTYDDTGAFVVIVDFPAGMQDDLIDQINAATHGDVQMEKRNI